MSVQLAKKLLVNSGKNEDWKGYKTVFNLLSPNFGYIHILTKWLLETPERETDLKEAWVTYADNKSALRSLNFKIEDCSGIEDWGDKMRELLRQSEVNKIIRSHFSNKYKFLVTDRVKSYFRILVESGVTSHSQVQDLFAAKLAAYKSPGMLESALESLVEKLTSKYDMEWVISKAERVGGFIVNRNEKLLLVETPVHSVLKKLGTSNWCITRSSSYFNSYVGLNNRQFILYNFNYPFGDGNHMIGITTNMNGGFKCGYNGFNNGIGQNSKEWKSIMSVRWIKPLTKEDVKNRYIQYLKNGINIKINELKKHFSVEEIFSLVGVRKSSSWWGFKSNFGKYHKQFNSLYERGLLQFTNGDYTYLKDNSFVRSKEKLEVKDIWLQRIKLQLIRLSKNPFYNVRQHDDFYNPEGWIKVSIPLKNEISIAQSLIRYQVNTKKDKKKYVDLYKFLSIDAKLFILINSSKNANLVEIVKIIKTISDTLKENNKKMSECDNELQDIFRKFISSNICENYLSRVMKGKSAMKKVVDIDILVPSKKYVYGTVFEDENMKYLNGRTNKLPKDWKILELKKCYKFKSSHDKNWIMYQALNNNLFPIISSSDGWWFSDKERFAFFLSSPYWDNVKDIDIIFKGRKSVFFDRIGSTNFHFESLSSKINKRLLEWIMSSTYRTLKFKTFRNRIEPFYNEMKEKETV